MKILIIGSGGREHAIAASVAKSPKAEKIYCAPGNAGIASVAECVDIKAMEFVGAVAEGKYYTAEECAELAKVPTREVLLGRLFGSMQSPIANFARVIKQIAEKDGEPAAAEAPAEA
jgi:hypothetical protein